MSRKSTYWIRALRSGGFEFYMAVPGNTMKGRAPTLTSVRDMREMFERQTGTVLPPAEKKPTQGGKK